VPEGLKKKRLVQLDLSAMVAGAKYRGSSKNASRRAEEITESTARSSSFWRDAHHHRRGRGEGAMDAGNMLKPMLARGELHLIGATTLMNITNTSRRTPP
jgi:ATP-dependent Clp protease ATP-binding subunit ClpB